MAQAATKKKTQVKDRLKSGEYRLLRIKNPPAFIGLAHNVALKANDEADCVQYVPFRKCSKCWMIYAKATSSNVIKKHHTNHHSTNAQSQTNAASQNQNTMNVYTVPVPNSIKWTREQKQLMKKLLVNMVVTDLDNHSRSEKDGFQQVIQTAMNIGASIKKKVSIADVSKLLVGADAIGNAIAGEAALGRAQLKQEECGNTGEEADAPIAKADDEDEYEEEKEPKDGDKAQDEYEDDADETEEDDADETEGVDEDEYEEENEPKEEAQDAIVKDEEMVADDGMHWIEGNDNWERDMPYDELRRWKIVWKTYFGIQKTFPNLEQDMDELWALMDDD
eukprot:316402_1